jgi:D-alanyl-lipoteichoic acid acyltransferase DltB (MBOAT superfamily)
MYGFAFQIYFDFSGYSDMARGLANLLGFHFPLNFTEPYLARNPGEFWRRWHITLSTWLRDYVYIPLGGNRSGPARVLVNLMITMLLGGLWHGASWNFVLWGGLNGLGLVVYRLVAGSLWRGRVPRWLGSTVSVLLTFHWISLLFVIFRTTSFEAALDFVAKLTSGPYAVDWPVLPLVVIVGSFVFQVVERIARENADAIVAWLGRTPTGALIQGLGYGALAALAVAASGQGVEFIYFQF